MKASSIIMSNIGGQNIGSMHLSKTKRFIYVYYYQIVVLKMVTIALCDIDEAMRDFYAAIGRNRAASRAATTTELEPQRNITIVQFVEGMKSYSQNPLSCLDVLSGDCIVPLAALYLQKQGVIPETLIDELFAVDDNKREGIDLMVNHAKSLGVESKLHPVQANFYEIGEWRQKLPSEGVGVVSAINANDHSGSFPISIFLESARAASEKLFVAQAVGMSGVGPFKWLLRLKYDVLREESHHLMGGKEFLYTACCTGKQ
jgi:hypothetical protein